MANDQKIIQHARQAKPAQSCSLYVLLAALGMAALSVLLAHKPARSQDLGAFRAATQSLPASAPVHVDDKPASVAVVGGVVKLSVGSVPEPPVTPPTVHANPLGGIWALQPPIGEKRFVADSLLKLGHVKGLIIRYRKSDIAGGYAGLDAQVNRCRQMGKKFRLLPMGPWERTSFAAMTRECGKRYADATAFHTGGASCGPQSSEEQHHPGGMPASAEADAKAAIDVADESFPMTTVLVFSIGGGAGARQEAVINYGLQKHPGFFAVAHNAFKLKDLPPQTPEQWLNVPHNRIVVAAVKRGALMDFEMVGPTVSNHPKKSSFPRCGTRNINEVAAQVNKLAAMAGIKPGDASVRFYPQDLAAVRPWW